MEPERPRAGHGYDPLQYRLNIGREWTILKIIQVIKVDSRRNGKL